MISPKNLAPISGEIQTEVVSATIVRECKHVVRPRTSCSFLKGDASIVLRAVPRRPNQAEIDTYPNA
jgi:hypothetical protein